MKTSKKTKIEFKHNYLFQIPILKLELQLSEYLNKILDTFPQILAQVKPLSRWIGG